VGFFVPAIYGLTIIGVISAHNKEAFYHNIAKDGVTEVNSVLRRKQFECLIVNIGTHVPLQLNFIYGTLDIVITIIY
jgi:hypothetical protein